MSGYSGVKLLRETYTLSNLHGIRVKASGRPDTYSPAKLIRHSHAILFAEGYTFVRIDHVRVRGRRFYADVYHFTSPPPASSSSVSHPRNARAFSDFRSRTVPVHTMIRHTCPVEEGSPSVEEDRKLVRTCYECVKRPVSQRLPMASPIPWYSALSVHRPLKTRYGFGLRPSLSLRQDRWGLSLGPSRRPPCIAVSISSQEMHRCCIGSRKRPRVVERGPPGTRRTPSAAADSFGGEPLRENTKRLPASKGRIKGTEGPVYLCEKYIHASTNFCGGEEQSCLRDLRRPIDRTDRSLRAHWLDTA